MSQIPTNIDNINSYDLLKLVKDIFDCIQDTKGNAPYVDIMSEDILIVTFEEKKFRVIIDDLSKNHSKFN